MASPLISEQFRIHNAQQFQEAFGEAAPTNMYFFIGRPQAWNTPTASGVTGQHSASYNSNPTENSPPTPIDNFNYQNEVYDDMIAMKKVNSSNTTLVVPRIDWVSGTKYSMYRPNYSADNKSNNSSENASNLYGAKFYVLNTNNYNVYKCIFAPSGANEFSTIAPTGTSTSIIDPGDGYKWLYMYTIGTDDVLKFLTTSYMPVSINSDVVTAAANRVGKIDTVVITSGGTGYNDGTYTNVPIRGDGTGGTVTITVSNNTVSSVVVTNGGNNYTFARVNVNNTEIPGIGGNGNAALEVIIPPPGGHGSNAYKELGAKRVMINVKLEYSESGEFPVDTDFRRIGILRDPKENNGTTASLATYNVLKSIKFPAGTTIDFLVDEVITQANTNAIGRVVSWDAVNKVLRYYQSEYEHVTTGAQGGSMAAFSGANAITGTNGSATPDTASGTVTINGTTIVNGYADSEIKKYTGDILYVENRRTVSRSSDQIEDVKLVVEF